MLGLKLLVKKVSMATSPARRKHGERKLNCVRCVKCICALCRKIDCNLSERVPYNENSVLRLMYLTVVNVSR